MRNTGIVFILVLLFSSCGGSWIPHELDLMLGKQSNTFIEENTNQFKIIEPEEAPFAYERIEAIRDHQVVVTHNFNQEQISKDFPNAKIIQIYPYTHVGNVLYNICFKKLNNTLDNQIDNYFLHIVEWYQHIRKRHPVQPCTNFWHLSNQQQVENLLGIKFTKTQEDFFKKYWEQQLAYSLSIPETPMSIEQLVSVWNIDNYFNNWSIAWTIFVYELINCRFEYQRLWSIDLEKFNSWEDLAKIQTRYDSNLTPSTN
jgi:hypothetical protein